jgi:hypothetical protein
VAGRLAWTFVLVLAFVVAPAHAKHHKTKHAPCLDQRYVIQGASPAEFIAIAARQISFGACPATSVSEKGTAHGTKLTAFWRSCPGLHGKARLKATIDPACHVLTGTFRAPKSNVKRPVTARYSFCGDGTPDAGNHEQCDGGTGCPRTQICDSAHCTCKAPPGLPKGGTTTTTTTTTTVPAPTCTATSGACVDNDQCCTTLCTGGFCNCHATGIACGQNAECCSSFCTENNFCDCFSLGDPCIFGAHSCCSGACRPSTATCCGVARDDCAADSDCCDNQCVSGKCTCVAPNGGCIVDGECCSGECANGTCACHEQEHGCLTDAGCCSGLTCFPGTATCKPPPATCGPNPYLACVCQDYGIVTGTSSAPHTCSDLPGILGDICAGTGHPLVSCGCLDSVTNEPCQ